MRESEARQASLKRVLFAPDAKDRQRIASHLHPHIAKQVIAYFRVCVHMLYNNSRECSSNVLEERVLLECHPLLQEAKLDTETSIATASAAAASAAAALAASANSAEATDSTKVRLKGFSMVSRVFRAQVLPIVRRWN